MNKRHFKRFYQKNFDKIYKFVFFRVGADRDLAEDLVSEIFVKALDKFHSYDPEKSSVAWIYTIARNHLANYFRSKYFRDVEPLEVDIWWQDQTWHMIDQDNDKKAFFNMLKQLNEHEQRLVTLKYLEGYNYKEMSKILAKPKTTLRVATHRAVLKLKKLAQTYELRETGEQPKQSKPAKKQI